MIKSLKKGAPQKGPWYPWFCSYSTSWFSFPSSSREAMEHCWSTYARGGCMLCNEDLRRAQDPMVGLSHETHMGNESLRSGYQGPFWGASFFKDIYPFLGDVRSIFRVIYPKKYKKIKHKYAKQMKFENYVWGFQKNIISRLKIISDDRK